MKRNIRLDYDYLQGYHDGYKEGIRKGLEYLVEKEQLKTDVELIIKDMKSK